MNFVELHRAFIPLRADQAPDLEVSRALGHRYGGWKTWPELLKHHRVVLLAEASSGKSEEFRSQETLLASQGKPAFFLRIEELAEHGFEATLDKDSLEKFNRWRNGVEDAWFFLDSIDEARLNRKNFESALKSFARDTATARPRAHVYISCRVSDWKGASDLAAIARWLPSPQKPAEQSVITPNDNKLLDPIFVDRPNKKKNTDDSDNYSLLVVQLAPLSEQQYRVLASAAGVADVDLFVQQIAQQGLEIFTERPGDLLELADFWQTNRMFASLSEMIEHSINRKVREADPDRPDNSVLSPEKAHIGSERIAAALTFGKSFTLRAPGSDPDPSLAAGALDAAQILPEWTDAERGALLRRGVFAPSTHGRVRFHHRATQEYLAARWLDGLLKSGCPRSEIHDLIFVTSYGVQTVAPSLRPAAAWLALWHPDIRHEIVRREPLLLIQHGDPGALPTDIRAEMLRTYSAKQANGEISDDRLDSRAISRFAHPDLSDAVIAAWNANADEHFRFDLLRVIRDGKIKGAAKLAVGEVLKASQSEIHRAVALQAVAACDVKPTLKAAASSLNKSPQTFSAYLAKSFCEVLYPAYLSTAELLRIIECSQPPSPRRLDGFAYSLRQLYDAANAANRARLMEGVARLCLTPPFDTEYDRISGRHKALAEYMEPIARDEVLRLGAGEPAPHLIATLMAVERGDRNAPRSEEQSPSLRELVQSNARLNRALFWEDVAEQRTNGGQWSNPANVWEVFLPGARRHLWGLSDRDLSWLYEDLSTRANGADKRIVLSAIVSIERSGGGLDAQRGKLAAATADDADLASALAELLAPAREHPDIVRHREEMERFEKRQADELALAKESWRKFRDELQVNPAILKDPSKLSSWKAGAYRLHHLTHWLQRRTGEQAETAVREWRLLEEGFGRPVAEAYREGMSLAWRSIKPERPMRIAANQTRTKWQTILAYAAIGIEPAEDPDWALGLSEATAKVAARHACYSDQGYPDWLDDLTDAFPDAVIPVIRKQVDAQWRLGNGVLTDFLWRFGDAARPVSQPVAAMLLSVFEGAEACSATELRRGLRVLRNLPLSPKQAQRLLKTARTRLKGHAAGRREEYVIAYLATILNLDPDEGVKVLASSLRKEPAESRSAKGISTFGVLFERHDPLAPMAVGRASVKCLEELLTLAYEIVRPQDDAVHEGSYSPDARDHAENARNAILGQLIERPGSDAFRAMERLANHPSLILRARRMKELARSKAERDSDLPAWTAEETRNFENEHNAPVKTGGDLLRVVLRTFADISFNLTKGDATSRPLLERAQDEDEVQQWIVEQLNARSKRRFHAFREAQVASGDKPDVIVASTAALSQVAIEVKHGGKGWTLNQLDSALRAQLAEDYLKPESRRHGVLVVTNHKPRRWLCPKTKVYLDFDQVIETLKSEARTITTNTSGAIEVACVGLDAVKAQSPNGRQPGTNAATRSATGHAGSGIAKRRRGSPQRQPGRKSSRER